jgi:DNA polymerase III delta subunit
MHEKMTDEELKEAIRTKARIAGLNLSEERIDIMLPSFKGDLAAIDSCRGFELAVEDEPSMIYRLVKVRK